MLHTPSREDEEDENEAGERDEAFVPLKTQAMRLIWDEILPTPPPSPMGKGKKKGKGMGMGKAEGKAATSEMMSKKSKGKKKVVIEEESEEEEEEEGSEEEEEKSSKRRRVSEVVKDDLPVARLKVPSRCPLSKAVPLVKAHPYFKEMVDKFHGVFDEQYDPFFAFSFVCSKVEAGEWYMIDHTHNAWYERDVWHDTSSSNSILKYPSVQYLQCSTALRHYPLCTGKYRSAAGFVSDVKHVVDSLALRVTKSRSAVAVECKGRVARLSQGVTAFMKDKLEPSIEI